MSPPHTLPILCCLSRVILTMPRGRQLAALSDMGAAILAVRKGAKYRKAAAKFNVSSATLHRRVNGTKGSQRPGRKSALRPSEELLIVNFLLRFAARSTPLTQLHLRQAIQIVIGGMPPARRLMLPFSRFSPGDTFMRSFRRRHADNWHSRGRFVKRPNAFPP